ncbi:thermonuclease family protein [Kingella negevensis]|uniref:thermonuclease family protein n=1 Tax=Kingella negevensis TaxID=1522312 RepID=UPI00254AF0E7|nr:thermonuclease family protein [Kingella negevensis]MDK4689679.1 thermonuclease family protein [Kingella negevensis]
MNKLLATIVFSLIATPVFALDCRVVGVSDGDTLTCVTAEQQRLKVRLNQIDAPEKGQDFGNAAKNKLSSLVYGKLVSLKTNGPDKYGRTIAEVFVNGLNANQEMVKTGYAWAYREYVKDNTYITLESRAKSASIGLWSQPNPIYPSDFRRGKRASHVHKPATISTANSRFSCDGRRFCKQMTSCAEARFYLTQCGVSRLDKDGDGVPCENLCRN